MDQDFDQGDLWVKKAVIFMKSHELRENSFFAPQRQLTNKFVSHGTEVCGFVDSFRVQPQYNL